MHRPRSVPDAPPLRDEWLGQYEAEGKTVTGSVLTPKSARRGRFGRSSTQLLRIWMAILRSFIHLGLAAPR